jgi:hypothetical protein
MSNSGGLEVQRKKRLLTAVAETQQNNTGDSAPSVVAPTNANLDDEIQRELAAKSVLLEKAKEKRDKIRGECDEFYRKRGGQGNRSKVHRNSVINSAALCTKLELDLSYLRNGAMPPAPPKIQHSESLLSRAANNTLNHPHYANVPRGTSSKKKSEGAVKADDDDDDDDGDGDDDDDQLGGGEEEGLL